jgi:uncharacterized protein (DUF1778 family)
MEDTIIRDRTVQVRVTRAERSLLRETATIKNTTVSDLIRGLIPINDGGAKCSID